MLASGAVLVLLSNGSRLRSWPCSRTWPRFRSWRRFRSGPRLRSRYRPVLIPWPFRAWLSLGMTPPRFGFAFSPVSMALSSWLPWRWPLTALALGGLATYGLVRLTSAPIELRVLFAFSEPLQLRGSVSHRLSVQAPVPMQVRAQGPLPITVAVHQKSPIDLRVDERTPLQVQVTNQTPVQLQVETKPVEVDVKEQSPVKVKIGL